MNLIHRVIWNPATCIWQVVSETAAGKSRSGRSTRRSGGRVATFTVTALLSGMALAELPTAGQVTSGAGTITQSGNVMTITQTTGKMAADWQSFSIGQGHTVNFVQPNASSIALNRVIGSDVSSIQGALNANGQVFLVNPNGVLFTPTSQVNVGGLVASTLDIDMAAFHQGRFRFSGESTQSIHNQGQINAATGGTLALVAARIVNDGTLNAPQGQVLLGAGDSVTLDMGGPVKLQVANARLETLIQNGGAIRAEGGTVWLTSQAAAHLASSVINHTGVIEAQALQSGPAGEVILFAHGGEMQLAGAIKADGGFVETSGKHFSVRPGASVQAAEWLIDPVNVTIDSTLAGTIETALGAGNVTITTDGGNTPSTAAGETAGDGDIDVNADIAWSTAHTLTLSAHHDINVNADINASHANAGVVFLYGQGSTDGGSSAYTQASGASVTANSQQWRKGSDLAGLRYGIVNGDLFLGSSFIEVGVALNTLGGKFGTSSKPSLFFGRQSGSGVGMVGDADGFGQGQDLRIDYFLPGSPEERFSAGYEIGGTLTQGGNFATQANGTTYELLPLGADNVIRVKVTTTLGGNLQVEQAISLGKNDKYFNNEVTLTNVGSNTLDNARFSRSFDPDNTVDMGGDYTTTQRIELSTAAGDSANVVSATSAAGDAYANLAGGSQSKIIYYAADDRTQVGFGGDFFGGALSSQVATAATQGKGDTETQDSGMGVIFNAGTLGAGQSASFSYLTSLDNRDINTILAELGAVAGARPTTTTTPASNLPADPLVGTLVPTLPALQPGSVTVPRPGNAPMPSVDLSSGDSLPVVDHVGGLAFVAVNSGGSATTTGEASAAGDTGDGGTNATQTLAAVVPEGTGGVDASGFMRVFLIDGGIALPAAWGDTPERRKAPAGTPAN